MFKNFKNLFCYKNCKYYIYVLSLTITKEILMIITKLTSPIIHQISLNFIHNWARQQKCPNRIKSEKNATTSGKKFNENVFSLSRWYRSMEMHKHNWEYENFSISRYFCISELSPRTCLCWCRERALSCLWENEKRNFSRFFLLFSLSLRSSTANACMIYDSLSCHIDFRMVLENYLSSIRKAFVLSSAIF